MIFQHFFHRTIGDIYKVYILFLCILPRSRSRYDPGAERKKAEPGADHEKRTGGARTRRGSEKARTPDQDTAAEPRTRKKPREKAGKDYQKKAGNGNGKGAGKREYKARIGNRKGRGKNNRIAVDR